MTRLLRLVLAVGVGPLALAGCMRAQLGWLVPKLELAASAHRQRALRDESARARWELAASAFLRWQPRSPATDVPLRFELEPESALSPCASDDDVCLTEAAEVERELQHVLRELP